MWYIWPNQPTDHQQIPISLDLVPEDRALVAPIRHGKKELVAARHGSRAVQFGDGEKRREDPTNVNQKWTTNTTTMKHFEV